MRAILLTILLSALLVSLGSAQSEARSLAGNWLATLDVGGTNLRLVLKVEKAGNGYAAKFDSPDQGARTWPSTGSPWTATRSHLPRRLTA